VQAEGLVRSTSLKVFRSLELPSQSAWALAALVALLGLALFQLVLEPRCNPFKLAAQAALAARQVLAPNLLLTAAAQVLAAVFTTRGLAVATLQELQQEALEEPQTHLSGAR
jgi:hypothetical protein